MAKFATILRQIVCFPIKLYQYFISPCLGPHCRFYPSCSQYAIDAVHQHGIFKGIGLAIHRLFRCHPGCQGGYDPVTFNQEN